MLLTDISTNWAETVYIIQLNPLLLWIYNKIFWRILINFNTYFYFWFYMTCDSRCNYVNVYIHGFNSIFFFSCVNKYILWMSTCMLSLYSKHFLSFIERRINILLGVKSSSLYLVMGSKQFSKFTLIDPESMLNVILHSEISE